MLTLLLFGLSGAAVFALGQVPGTEGAPDRTVVLIGFAILLAPPLLSLAALIAHRPGRPRRPDPEVFS